MNARNHGDAELRVSVQPRRRGTTETRSSGIPFEEEGRSSVVPWLQGQVIVEYFALFLAVVLVSLLWLTTFDDRVKGRLTDFISSAAAKTALQ